MTGQKVVGAADRRSKRRPLNTRELEVVSHLAEGRTYAETGRAMFLSHASVKRHVHEALVAMGARSAAQLCVLAVRSGQLP